MDDLFPSENLLSLATKTKPKFRLSRLNIYSEISELRTQLIRSIPFQEGLNIVWAEPAEREEKDKSKRGKGHSAGKTTLCRFIRYALGEESYGRDVFKKRLNNSDIAGAWITAEVIVDGVCWAIMRPLYSGNKQLHSSLKDSSIGELLETPRHKRQPFEHFRTAIGDSVQQHYPVDDFGTKSSDPITWLHSIQWLTRDQETHMGGLFKWRAPESNSQSPELPHEKAQLLAKTILGVSSTQIRDKNQSRKQLLGQQLTASDDLVFYQRLINETLADVRQTLPESVSTHDVSGELQINAIVTELKGQQTLEQAEFDRAIAELNIDQLEEARDAALRQEALTNDHRASVESELDKKQQACEKLFSDNPPSDEELEKYINALPPKRSHCQVPIKQALFKCPVLREHRANQAGLCPTSPAELDTLDERLSILKREASEEIEELRKALDIATSNHQLALQNFTNADKALTSAKAESKTLSKQLASALAELDDLTAAARRIDSQNTRIQDLHKALDDLKSDIRRADTEIQTLQSLNSGQEAQLSNIFDAVVKYIKGENSLGKLKFTAQGIEASIFDNGERDSGAYKALGCILFDITAVIAKLRGIGNHPAFLLHDSPRESEMEPSLYLPIFNLMADLQSQAACSFQYIVTTTEAPPESLTGSHVALRLDGATTEGRLLMTDL